MLLPFMSDRCKVTVSRTLFLALLDEGLLTYDELKEKHQCSAFEGMEPGSAVMFAGEVYATVWIGVNNVSLMVNKEEIRSFRFLLQP